MLDGDRTVSSLRGRARRRLYLDVQTIFQDPRCVSMLDVSLRAGVLELLARLRRERGLSLLHITHDLLSARVVTDQILVLNKGRVVERGVTKEVLQHPTDEYTVALLDAIATPGSDGAQRAPGGRANPTVVAERRDAYRSSDLIR